MTIMIKGHDETISDKVDRKRMILLELIHYNTDSAEVLHFQTYRMEKTTS